MTGEGIVTEATTSSSTELLLPNRALYARSLYCTNDEFKSFLFYLR